jgi:hypothetical protein
VRIIAAANSIEDGAGSWTIAPAVANRMGHLEFPDPSVEEWSSWMLAGSKRYSGPVTNAAEEEAKVLEHWDDTWAVAAGVVTSFLQRRPGLLRDQPDASDPRSSGAWASPRSWSNATRALTSSIIHGLTDDERDMFISCFIGDGPAMELITWISDQDLADPMKVLSGEEKFEHDPTRLDRTMALLNACTALTLANEGKVRNEMARTLWALVDAVSATALDVGVPTVNILLENGLVGFPEATKVLAKLHIVV